MYFDALNGNPGAEDASVNIYVFRKRDNAAIGYVQAPKIERKSVSYANPQCGISTLQTYMITYSADVRLEKNSFDDPQGYYMVLGPLLPQWYNYEYKKSSRRRKFILS